MTHPEKCSAYINGKCTNGYPDHVTSRCGVCYGRDHGAYWAPCTSEKFSEIWYPETGTPLKELVANRQEAQS